MGDNVNLEEVEKIIKNLEKNRNLDSPLRKALKHLRSMADWKHDLSNDEKTVDLIKDFSALKAKIEADEKNMDNLLEFAKKAVEILLRII